MHFLSPSLLLWGLLVLPVALLFLVRRRPRQVRVSTLAFFKSLSKAYQEAPWLRRLKRILAFALAVGMLLSLVGAWAHLVVAPQGDDLRSVLVVVDGSASMGARDNQGTSRMELARTRIRQRLSGLPAGVGVLLMRYDRRPEILLPHSLDRRALDRALDRLSVRPIAGDAEAALLLAGQLAGLQAPAAIWHVTDDPTPPRTATPAPDASSANAAASDTAPVDTSLSDPAAPVQEGPLEVTLPSDVSLETIQVGLANPRNVGITAVSLRPRPLERGRFDAFVEVSASGPAPIEAQLEIQIDERLVSLRDLTILPSEQERLLIPIEGAVGSTLALTLHMEGDVLPTDDRVLARIPDVRPIRLLWVRAASQVDPFTALALAALGEDGVLEAYESEPDAYAGLKDRFDVVLFDGWLPPKWPTDVPVLVMKPPRSLGPVKTAPIGGTGLPTKSLRAIDETHPVLFGVASQRVSVTQTSVLEAGDLLTPLWLGDMGPLLVAGEVGGQKIVIMAFAPDRSEHLGLLASYPLLIGNAIFWLVQQDAARRSGNNQQTGTLVDTSAFPLEWEVPPRTPKETSPPPFESSAARVRVALLDRQGLWRVGDTLGSSSLLSRNESVFPARKGDSGISTEDKQDSWLTGDLRPALLGLLFLLLLIEAWLFHRRAVY